MRFVREFARKTGDLGSLSGTDLEVLGLCYEVEVERNAGDWRLRRAPGQKGLNARRPVREDEGRGGGEAGGGKEGEVQGQVNEDGVEGRDAPGEVNAQDREGSEESAPKPEALDPTSSTADALTDLNIQNHPSKQHFNELQPSLEQLPTSDHSASDNDDTSDTSSDGWITPSNLHNHHPTTSGPPSTTPLTTNPNKNQKKQPQKPPPQLAAALLTADSSMQNVALHLNLNLLSPFSPSQHLHRIRHIRTHLLRCHACFQTLRPAATASGERRQFCPRCGLPTLTKVSATVTDAGETKVHLKRNFQWNRRGERYSVPKPAGGSASGKWRKGAGGGKGGWGREMVLAEDERRSGGGGGGGGGWMGDGALDGGIGWKGGKGGKGGGRDLMDEDVLPGLITGERRKGGGRVRVGTGRDVNSRRY